jgi:[protein-PII] uridylyltransferase
MWNAWKGRLLKELYDRARLALGGETADIESEGPTRAFHLLWKARFGEALADAWVASLPSRYFQSTDLDRAILHGRLLARAGRSPLLGYRRRRRSVSGSVDSASESSPDAITELTLLAPDRPGLLALFAGVLAAYRIDILRARITSTRNGYALDVFDVRGPGGLPLETSKWRAARRDLARVLSGPLSVEDLLRKRRGTALLKKHLPPVKTKVQVDNQASQDFTVVDVQVEDQVGLLYAIASALKEVGAQIAQAYVSTEANRATDSFYITREGEKVVEPEAVRLLIQQIERALP